MGDKLDAEKDRIASDGASKTEKTADAAGQLALLQRELEASESAGRARVDGSLDRDTLAVSVRGQPIGAWRAEGDTLVLYRPGSSSAVVAAWRR